ncbi:hypothetical protein OSTOST_18004, partial [Ostertagia ostertagi]
RRLTSDDACSSSAVEQESRQHVANGKDVPFEIPSRRMPSQNLQHIPPPDPRQNTPTGFPHNRSVGSDGFELKQPAPQLRTSMMRDEHTGKMVTVVRGDDDDFEDPRRGRDQPTGLDGNWRDPRRQAGPCAPHPK